MDNPITCTYNKYGEQFFVGDVVSLPSRKGTYVIKEFYKSIWHVQPCWNAEDGSSAWLADNITLVARAKDAKEDGWTSV